MRFVCTQQNLLQGLAKVAPLTGKNKQLPILQYVLCQAKEGELHLTGTDLEIGTHITVAGKIEEEGSVAINARKLLEYVQQLPHTHPLYLESNASAATLVTEGFKAQFPVVSTEEFPLLPVAPTDKKITMPAAALCEGLLSTSFAAAREETRPEIHRVFLKPAGA